jgi:hypothetical protein
MQQQDRQQRPLLIPAQADKTIGGAHLKRTQNSIVHQLV